MTKTKSGNEIATIDAYPALADAAGFQALLAETFAGEQLTINDLMRLKTPSGGGKFFELPLLEGPTPASEFSGIILHHHLARSYWTNPDPSPGTPPSCTSPDAVRGVGTPGGECAVCPLAQYETDPKGRGGQACKLKRHLFFFTNFSSMPVFLCCPTQSVAATKSYLLQLVNSREKFWGVETRFSLETVTAKAGDPYSRLKLSFLRRLADEELAIVEAARASMLPLLTAVSRQAASEV